MNKINCTWDNQSNCQACENKSKLNCKYNPKHLRFFYLIFLPVMACHLFSFSLIGYLHQTLILPIAYLLFWPVFLGLFEIRFLCSHCPYYEKKGLLLRCPANYGLLRLYKYRPGPLNRFEKFLMILLILIITLIFPLGSNGYLFYYILTKGTANTQLLLFITGFLTIITFLVELLAGAVMKKDVCSRCVNFSCPVNQVTVDVRNAYIRKNPLMKKAWEEAGVVID